MAHGRIGSQSVSGVAIYMEGGGTGRDTKNALRQGMNAFLGTLKDAAREKAWHWKLVCCGGRDETFRAFRVAERTEDYKIVVLLVDAEDPINGLPHAHLNARDGWDLKKIEDKLVHLMAQTMETWIVADANTLAAYYQKEFNRNLLPATLDLEMVAKVDVASALVRATEKTRKGKYHKIQHASDLLKRMDPSVVRRRCSWCDRLFAVIGCKIAKG